jgi:hypothetical protein
MTGGNVNPITGNARLTREEAEGLTGPELAEAFNNGDLSRELGEDLFVADRVRIIPGPNRGRCRYSVRIFGWGKWWMPSLPPSAGEAWREAQAVAEKYGIDVEFADEVDEAAFREEAGI